MSARMGLLAFLSLRLDADKAHALIREFRDEVIAERDAQIIAWLCKKAGEYGVSNRENRAKAEAVGRMADKLSRGAVRTAEKATPTGEAAPQDVTVYRAAYEHEPFPLGLYATRAAAEAHCEADVSREHPAGTALFFEWCVDEDDSAVCELDVRIGDEHTSTGYSVTAVVADATYDPEAGS